MKPSKRQRGDCYGRALDRLFKIKNVRGGVSSTASPLWADGYRGSTPGCGYLTAAYGTERRMLS